MKERFGENESIEIGNEKGVVDVGRDRVSCLFLGNAESAAMRNGYFTRRWSGGTASSTVRRRKW